MEVRKVKYTAEPFMEEVQKYECLYKKYSKDFKVRNKKPNAWIAVVSQFHDLLQTEAVNKLKNIRSAYTRFLKRKKSTPSGSGRDAVPTPKPDPLQRPQRLQRPSGNHLVVWVI